MLTLENYSRGFWKFFDFFLNFIFQEPTHEFVVPKVEPQSQSQNQTQEPEQEADQLETDDGERQQENQQNPDHELYPDFQEQVERIF